MRGTSEFMGDIRNA